MPSSKAMGDRVQGGVRTRTLGRMRWTIPNILTVFRLAAAPGVALAFVVFQRPTADWVAITLFILAALTLSLIHI